jgi:endonuclease/exonuclease/phosphatase family metal-dependent hydrolase
MSGGERMVKIATFNIENLFARYRFKQGRLPFGKDAFTVEQIEFDELDKEGRTELKAMAIREADADIVCLQEVDSLPALDHFTSKYLGGARYHHRLLIDGNDPRGINVGVLSRHEIVSARSHRHERVEDLHEKLFSRDCLELEFDVCGKPLWVCNNHNKSMRDGRAETRETRLRQVRRIAEILDRARSSGRYGGNLVVLGDFNDYAVGGHGDPLSSLGPLLGDAELVDMIGERIDEKDERYTHFYGGADGSKGELQYATIDYLFVEKALATSPANARRKPVFVRNGMGHQVLRYQGPRFGGVGHAMPFASDHALVWIELDLL